MATRMNPLAGRYFNDPNMATAMSNLASAFAPPSADEALGWAQLRGVNDENARLSTLWEAAGNDFDRMGVAAGQWNPTQSYYAVDTADATARRGQDISASTSMSNNAADNDRALRTAVLGAATDPNGRQAVDDQMMSAILGTEMPGFSMAGPVAPSETQVLGANLQDQLGGIPGLAEALAADGVDASNVVTPDGVRMQPTGLAALQGAEPFVNKGAEAAMQPVVLLGPEGEELPGFFNPSTGQYSTSDGQPVPPGFRAARLAQPQGSNEELGITTSNQTDYRRVQQTVVNSNLLIDELQGLIGSRAGAAGLPGTLQMLAQDFVQVGRELGTAFGADPNAIVSQEDLLAIAGLGENYDPVFRQIRAGMLQLAYLNAQRDNPRGEVSRFALERQIEALGQGMLSNDQSVLASLEMSRSANDRALRAAEALVGRAGAVPAPAGTPPPAATPRPRAQNAAGDVLEWNGQAWVPVQ